MLIQTFIFFHSANFAVTQFNFSGKEDLMTENATKQEETLSYNSDKFITPKKTLFDKQSLKLILIKYYQEKR